MPDPSLTVAMPLLALLAAATVSDLRTRRIPNALSFGGAAFGLLLNAVAFGSSALGLAVLGWILCLVCFLPLYLSGGTAAGDVKLMAMVGAFLGPLNGFVACVVTLVAGALLASLTMAKRNFSAPQREVGSHPAERHGAAVLEARPAGRPKLDKIPYAAAIALGGLAAVAQPAWLTHLLP